jgi:drug/metabolite transporter (DMT)-like permease
MRSWFVLACIAGILSGCWGFCIKLALSDGADFFVITVISSVMAFAVPLGVAWYRRVRKGMAVQAHAGGAIGVARPPDGTAVAGNGTSAPNLWLALVSGLLAGGGQLGYFGALSEGPASIVAPLSGLYPAVTIVLSVVLLKEQVGKLELLGIALALLAPVLMLL